MLNKAQVIQVKDTWIPFGNWNNIKGFKIRINLDSVIDNEGMMSPRAHHSQSLNRATITRGYGDPDDTGPMASLDHPAQGKTEQEGGNRPPG